MIDIYTLVKTKIEEDNSSDAIEILNSIPQGLRTFDWYQLHGYASGNLGDYVNSLHYLGKAATLAPDNLEIQYYLAIAQFKSGLIDQAVKNLHALSKKLNFHIEVLETLVDFAIVAKDYTTALDSLKILTKKSKNPETYIRRTIELYASLGKYEDALIAYGWLRNNGFYKALDIGHENYLRMILSDWTMYQQVATILKNDLNFFEFFMPTQLPSLPSNAFQQFQTAKNFSNKLDTCQNTLTVNQNQKIKIGYFSSDFHNHATAYLVVELLELHCRNDFEVHCFSYGPNKNDQLRNRVKNSVDYFHELSAATDDEIIELSRNLNIDIAIDMKGYGINQRLDIFAKRVAPIQVNYLVYPGTMGTSFHDYIIADKYLIPEDQQLFYTEKVLYMDSSYQVSVQKREISPDAGTKKSWGLKEDHFIFACFNNNYKITPDIFDVWLNILLSVPNSQLWLLEDNSMAKKNLIKYAKKRHLTQDRLVFAPRVDIPRHLARHRHVDLMLDTPYYNAHTTANDALFMGVPILTVEGNTFASRVCGSLLKDVYLDDLIAQDFFNYQEKAIDLAINRQRLVGYKSHLSNKGDLPLFNIQGKVRNIEQLYKKILNRS